MNQYVAGFLFHDDFNQIVLIKKLKGPKFNIGLLNAIGGKIEENEFPSNAMAREFQEETGFRTEPDFWDPFLKLEVKGNVPLAQVIFYRAFTKSQIDIQSMEDEPVHSIYLSSFHITPWTWHWPKMDLALAPNLPWIIPMALNGRAKMATVLEVHQ